MALGSHIRLVGFGMNIMQHQHPAASHGVHQIFTIPLDSIDTQLAASHSNATGHASTHTYDATRFTDPVKLDLKHTTIGNTTLQHPYISPNQSVMQAPQLIYNTRSKQQTLTPLSVFERVFMHDIVNRWCTDTNYNLHKSHQRKRSANTHPHTTHDPVVPADFFRMCGRMLLEGQMVGSRISEYRIPSDPSKDRIHLIRTAITNAFPEGRYDEVRFASSLSHIHDENDSRYHQRMDWVIADTFDRTLQLYSITNPILTYDDQTIPFKDRCNRKEGPNSRKTDKYGVKFDALCDSKGFTLGMKWHKYVDGDEFSELNQGGDVNGESEDEQRSINKQLLSLIKHTIPNPRGFEVIMDNGYTSHALFDELAKLGVMATGTVRSNWLTHTSPSMHLSKKEKRNMKKGI